MQRSTDMAELSLERVQIDGFRGLRGLDLDGLGRINILIGANDSGKTSVLEALSVLCKPFEPNEWLEMIGRRDFGRLDETVIESARWCFRQNNEISGPDSLFSAYCEFMCEGQFPLRRLAVHYWERVEQQPARNKLVSSLSDQTIRVADLCYVPMLHESFSGKQPPEGLQIKQVIYEDGTGATILNQDKPTWRISSGPSLVCEMLAPYSHQINRLQVSALSKQILHDYADQGLSMLQGFDPDVMAVQVLSLHGDRPAIYVQHRRLGWAPLSVFGDAMRRCVLLSATLPGLKGGGVLLIDEVETGIHIKALGRVFQWLIESAWQLNVQVFVTTHSLEALDALILAPSAQEGDVVAFQLSRSDTLTATKRFAGDLLLRLRQERGLDLR
jgi:energy-coupling factor transporter ATP-binding protein EcfA2